MRGAHERLGVVKMISKKIVEMIQTSSILLSLMYDFLKRTPILNAKASAKGCRKNLPNICPLRNICGEFRENVLR